jgi:RNA polymerase sigma-70 factor (ECF subfamily)
MIVQRYNRRLYRVARAVLRDDAEAEDVVQETYMKAFANLGSFRGDAALATWLTRIALNEALGRRRRRNRRTDIEARGIGDERAEGSLIMFPVALAPSNPEMEVSRRQVRDLLEKAVDALPEPFRMVFVLRDIEDLSIEETAKQLDLKPQTVKTRLHRARRLIRGRLDKALTSAYFDLFPFDGARCVRMADKVIARLRGDSRGFGGAGAARTDMPRT